MDPVLAALEIVAEGLSAELAVRLLERRRGHGRRGSDRISRQKVKRMLDGTASQLGDALQGASEGIAEHEWRAAVLAVGDSLEAVAPVAVDDALGLDLRADRLDAHVRERAQPVLRKAGLSADGWSAFDRVLAATCEQIMQAVAGLPEFAASVQAATFQDLRDVRRAVDGLARSQGQPPRNPDPEPRETDFGRRYLDHVVRTLGRLELFGVSRGRAPRSRSLDRSYVSMAVARSGRRPPGEDDDELTGAGVDVANSFQDHRRVLLRGGAGAGKTTLLRWLAVTAARDVPAEGDGPGPAPATHEVPFFVPLRQFAQRDLPAPEDMPAAVAKVIAAETPAGWANELFASGRAVLLVDGVDELEPVRRLEARDWLEQLLGAYEDVRVVVSARPFAIPEDWLAAAGFVTFDLLPLSPKGARDFLAAWHDAAREEHASDPEMQDWLDECELGLAEQLAARVELRRLAGSPLLCGLLCALHQDRNMHLPRDRKGLYDAALDLLLVRWDESRGVRVDEYPSLSQEEQVVLLQRFAYSMVKNHELVVPRDEAARRFGHAMRGLRSQDIGPEPVLQRSLERSGLLREPEADEVQFVHRTFRDYLAAKEVVDAGDLAFVAEQAHLDHWHDVVVNAVALARPAERDWLLRRLVDGNAAARADVRVQSRLRLVAAACLEHADVLDSDEARQVVQQAAAELIPPASLDEADLLSRAGPFVLDLLPGPDGLTPDQAACVVRTAAMVGGPGVREKLAQFVAVDESRVIDELLRAWRRSDDPDGYARQVLADIDFGERSLEVRGWHRVRCLKHLERLTNVVCYGDFADLDAVADVPHLCRLELVQNELVRALHPLARSSTLRTLRLTTGCQFLKDLSPLASTTVEELGLHLVSAELGTVPGRREGRLRRLAIRDPRLTDGLHPLPDDLGIEELVLDNLPRSRNLQGIERWTDLVDVTIRGLPRPDEVEALAGLPSLVRLHLVGVGPGDEGLDDLRAALPDVAIRQVDA